MVMFLYGTDGSILCLHETSDYFESYIPDNLQKLPAKTLVFSQSSLAAVTEDRKLVMMGQLSRGLQPDCGARNDCYLPDKPLQNIVKIIASSSGFTAMMTLEPSRKTVERVVKLHLGHISVCKW